MVGAGLASGWFVSGSGAARDLDSGLCEQAATGNQRQADEAGRIAAADFLEQADAEPLALEAAGAIVGGFQGQVALDFRKLQRAEAHRGDVERLEPAPIADQGDGGKRNRRCALTARAIARRQRRDGPICPASARRVLPTGPSRAPSGPDAAGRVPRPWPWRGGVPAFRRIRPLAAFHRPARRWRQTAGAGAAAARHGSVKPRRGSAALIR